MLIPALLSGYYRVSQGGRQRRPLELDRKIAGSPFVLAAMLGRTALSFLAVVRINLISKQDQPMGLRKIAGRISGTS
jgi:hypothetical protein